MTYKRNYPDLNNYFKLPNVGLLNFLNNNEVGLDIDVRTPLFNKEPRSNVISEWLSIVNKYRHKLLSEQYDDELDQSTKVGRFSSMFPFAERENDVIKYYSNHNLPVTTISNKYIQDALNEYKSEHKFGGVRKSSFVNCINNMKLNTNSGSPYFMKRHYCVEKTLSELRFATTSTKRLTSLFEKRCCILGWRGTPIDKQRVVWMFPFDLNVLESQYYQPRIKQIQNRQENPAFISSKLVEQSITNLFDSKSSSDLVIATDFNSFDSHFNKLLQDLSFEIKKYHLGPNFTSDEFLIHYNKFNIPLLCTKNVMYFGPHGMASGSTGTNQDENEAHEIMQRTCALYNNSTLNKYSQRLGDDGVLSYPGISVDNVTDVYVNLFGQSMNKSKQYSANFATKYLQRLYHIGFRKENTIVGVYPTFRALGRLLGQERYYDPEKWSKEMVILRSLSIIENCNRHPLFEQFIDFIVSGDKYGLGINIPGFLDKLGSKSAKDLYSDVPNILSYSKQLELDFEDSGIGNWQVYKYLIKRSQLKPIL